MQLLTFMLNNVRFGIPVDDVESIETRKKERTNENSSFDSN